MYKIITVGKFQSCITAHIKTMDTNKQRILKSISSNIVLPMKVSVAKPNSI